MALISCPDCQKQISDRARVCPQCGRPGYHLSFLSQDMGAEGVVLKLLILAGVIIWMLWNPAGLYLVPLGLIALLIRSLR